MDNVYLAPGNFYGANNFQVTFPFTVNVFGSGMGQTLIACSNDLDSLSSQKTERRARLLQGKTSVGDNSTGLIFSVGGTLVDVSITSCIPALIVSDANCGSPFMNVTRVDFSENEYGISQSWSSSLSISNSNFYNLVNAITTQGTCLKSTYLTIDSTNFTQTQYGSSIYFTGPSGINSAVSTTLCNFLNSEAGDATGPQGPAMSVVNASAQINNCVFANNTFGGNGAAVSISGGSLFVFGSIFVENYAMNGGAIFVSNLTSDTSAQLLDNVIIGNFAKANGGGFYCSSCLIIVGANLIERNVANVGGAGYCSKDCVINALRRRNLGRCVYYQLYSCFNCQRCQLW